MIRQAQAAVIVQALAEIKRIPPTESYGICGAVYDIIKDAPFQSECVYDTWRKERENAFLSWTDTGASGCEVFPISGAYGGGVEHMWQVGVVADARWRLVDHLIQHFNAIAVGEAK